MKIKVKQDFRDRSADLALRKKGEVMFTADGDIAFDGFGADAQRTIDVKEMVQEQGALAFESHILLEMFYIYKKALPKECLFLAETVYL